MHARLTAPPRCLVVCRAAPTSKETNVSTEPIEYPEDDYDHGPEIPTKEEPDCYSCNDGGCPDCGSINPEDPEHLRFVARQIMRTRATAPSQDELYPVLDSLIFGFDPNAGHGLAATVYDLISTAIVTITWPEPGQPYSTERPF